jgi:hypothetical protein
MNPKEGTSPFVPSAPPAAVPPASTASAPQTLPRSVQQLLGWLDPREYNKVETVLCGMPLTREVVLAARFLDQVWNHARNAEYRIGTNRISGTEMDGYYGRFQFAVGELVSIGVELARRSGLTEILQRHKKVLIHHGFQPNGQKVHEGGKSAALPPPAPVKKDAAPANLATMAAA